MNNQDSTFGDISRESLDASDIVTYQIITEPGLREEVIKEISASNNEPQWMLELRLKAFEEYQKMSMPKWGPNLEKLKLDEIYYFAKPEGAKNSTNWEDVPEEIKKTFDRLGIPEAERKMLAGTGAQYDSEVVYHNLREELKEKGVIFEDMSVALHKYEDIVKAHFMKAIPITDHKFAALHAAVWSGGTFLYIPKGVKVDAPVQAYFRMNARAGGQFEHTMIILEEDSEAHYIEGCSAPKYNTPSLHAGGVEIYV